MKKKENYGYGSCGRDNDENVMGNSAQITDDQAMVLEKLFGECVKPSHRQRLGMVCENPVLSDLDSEQLKGWFHNRRFIEKQRKAVLEFQSVNDKLAATKKLLLEDNDFLRKELMQLVRENGYIRKLLKNVTDSDVNSDHCSSMSADNSKRFFLSAEETMREFSPTATQSALDCVSPPRMKIQESLLKQLYNHQGWLFCCSFEETEHDQISRTVGQESPTSILPPMVPQVINLYTVCGEEQGPLFPCGYISCK